MKKVLYCTILLITLLSPAAAQTGGDNVYEFLNLTHSGLVASLGGSNVSLAGNNLNLSYHNPALLNHGMDKTLALNYVNYFAGINYGLAMYSGKLDSRNSFAAGITYLNYGSFREADASGNITGEFGASEYAISLICSHQIDTSFSFGANLKPVLSHLDDYTSFGLALDLGASWVSKNRRTSAGLTMRNAGWQITDYAGEPREKLPFEIIGGVSQRLAYAPFRISLTYRHLEKWDLSLQDTQDSEPNVKPAFLETLLMHTIPAIEILPHKNFYLSAGYNFQRRKELNVPAGSASGISWGFGINTAWIDLEFGRAIYHLAGASNNISLIIRPSRIYRRNRE